MNNKEEKPPHLKNHDSFSDSGQRKIYEDLLDLWPRRILPVLQKILIWSLNEAGEVEIPFFGANYLVPKVGCGDRMARGSCMP